jgi:hypothetical protein
MRHRIVIANATATAAAYAEDRRPHPGEGDRVIVIEAPPGLLHLNGAVQEVMMEEGFDFNDWKIVSHSEDK